MAERQSPDVPPLAGVGQDRRMALETAEELIQGEEDLEMFPAMESFPTNLQPRSSSSDDNGMFASSQEESFQIEVRPPDSPNGSSIFVLKPLSGVGTEQRVIIPGREEIPRERSEAFVSRTTPGTLPAAGIRLPTDPGQPSTSRQDALEEGLSLRLAARESAQRDPQVASGSAPPPPPPVPSRPSGGEVATARAKSDIEDELVSTVSRELCEFCLGRAARGEATDTTQGSEQAVPTTSSTTTTAEYSRHYCLRPGPRPLDQSHQPSLDCLSDHALKRIMSYMTLVDICNKVQSLNHRLYLLANSREVMKERLYVVRDSSVASGNEVVKFISKFPTLPGIIFLVPVNTSLLSELTHHARNLKRLEFNKGQDFNTPEMMDLFRLNPGLRTLVLPSHALDNEEVASKLLSYVQHVETLYLSVSNEDYWNRVPITLLAHFSDLSKVSFPHLCCNIDDLKYFLIQKCHDLTALEISWQAERSTQFSLVKMLYMCSKLERLVTVGSTITSDREACFRAMENLRSLKELRLKHLGGTSSRRLISFFARAEFFDLEQLEISDVDVLTDSVAKAIVNRFKKLVELRLMDSNGMSGPGLSELYTLQDLRILSFSGSTRLGDEAMDHISKCSGLQELDLSYCGMISKRALELVGSLRNLRHLGVEACELGGNLFDILLEMPGMRSFSFDFSYGVNLQSAKLLREYKPWLWRDPLMLAHERGYYDERFGKDPEDYTVDNVLEVDDQIVP